MSRIPQIWDEEIGIVVVGSGFAGLSAAAEAAGLGVETVIFEKLGQYGGNSIISGGGYCSTDSSLHLRQHFDLGDDSCQLHVEDTLKGGDYYGIPELVEVMVKGAPDGLNWLLDAGAKLQETLPRIGGHSAARSHMAKGSGRGLTEPLRKLALKRGATLRMNTRVTAIWREDRGGPVLGVEVVTEGKPKNIKVGQALILASGGFSADVKMRMEVNPALVPEYGCTNLRGATGEIIRYARAVWADVLHLAFVQLYPCANPKNSGIDLFALQAYSGTGYGLFYVNTMGKRFVNELDRRDVVSSAQIKSGGKPSYSILNRKMFQKLDVSEKSINNGVARGRLIESKSVSGLAHELRVPAATFEETVNNHNDYLKRGKDPDFNKPITNAMVLMDDGPFYAFAQWPAIHHCMGGLRIDGLARVIDIWGKPIPKLYAAGEVCGGIHGSNRLGGNAIPDCIVFGRIAGINAAAEKPSFSRRSQ